MIVFSEEQAMLLDTANEFCQNQAPRSAVRDVINAGTAMDPALWQTMVDLGWLGISIPESYGGLGMNLADAVPIFEAMGRQLMDTPLLATTLAAQVLIQDGSENQKSTWLPKISAGTIAAVAYQENDGNWDLGAIDAVLAPTDSGEFILSGTKMLVPDAEVAEVFIVSACLQGKPVWCLVSSESLESSQFERETVIDETRHSYCVQFSDVAVSPDDVLPLCQFHPFEMASMMLITAEMSGGLAGVLEVVVDYLNTRKQFDKLIGSYQALKHPTVDMLLGSELVRSTVYHAATAWRENESASAVETAIRMAKCCASEQFSEAGDRGIQFHGGFGFTYDCDAQLFLRRALWSQYQLGDERYQRQKLGGLFF